MAAYLRGSQHVDAKNIRARRLLFACQGKPGLVRQEANVDEGENGNRGDVQDFVRKVPA